jgi:hypothetical protein
MTPEIARELASLHLHLQRCAKNAHDAAAENGVSPDDVAKHELTAHMAGCADKWLAEISEFIASHAKPGDGEILARMLLGIVLNTSSTMSYSNLAQDLQSMKKGEIEFKGRQFSSVGNLSRSTRALARRNHIRAIADSAPRKARASLIAYIQRPEHWREDQKKPSAATISRALKNCLSPIPV